MPILLREVQQLIYTIANALILSSGIIFKINALNVELED
jgi:hypothetical protein